MLVERSVLVDLVDDVDLRARGVVADEDVHRVTVGTLGAGDVAVVVLHRGFPLRLGLRPRAAHRAHRVLDDDAHSVELEAVALLPVGRVDLGPGRLLAIVQRARGRSVGPGVDHALDRGARELRVGRAVELQLLARPRVAQVEAVVAALDRLEAGVGHLLEHRAAPAQEGRALAGLGGDARGLDLLVRALVALFGLGRALLAGGRLGGNVALCDAPASQLGAEVLLAGQQGLVLVGRGADLAERVDVRDVRQRTRIGRDVRAARQAVGVTERAGPIEQDAAGAPRGPGHLHARQHEIGPGPEALVDAVVGPADAGLGEDLGLLRRGHAAALLDVAQGAVDHDLARLVLAPAVGLVASHRGGLEPVLVARGNAGLRGRRLCRSGRRGAHALLQVHLALRLGLAAFEVGRRGVALADQPGVPVDPGLKLGDGRPRARGPLVANRHARKLIEHRPGGLGRGGHVLVRPAQRKVKALDGLLAQSGRRRWARRDGEVVQELLGVDGRLGQAQRV